MPTIDDNLREKAENYKQIGYEHLRKQLGDSTSINIEDYSVLVDDGEYQVEVNMQLEDRKTGQLLIDVSAYKIKPDTWWGRFISKSTKTSGFLMDSDGTAHVY
jgi:hypothetical protein